MVTLADVFEKKEKVQNDATASAAPTVLARIRM